jgi:hypothetical protein
MLGFEPKATLEVITKGIVLIGAALMVIGFIRFRIISRNR